jgi:hypothetical protein
MRNVSVNAKLDAPGSPKRVFLFTLYFCTLDLYSKVLGVQTWVIEVGYPDICFPRSSSSLLETAKIIPR